INKALAKNASQRYSSAGEVATAFKMALSAQTLRNEARDEDTLPPTTLSAPPRRNSTFWKILVAVLIVAIGLGLPVSGILNSNHTITPTAFQGPAVFFPTLTNTLTGPTQVAAGNNTPTVAFTITAFVQTATPMSLPTSTATLTPNDEATKRARSDA